jgi:acyl-CoA thioesterase FadM
VAGETIKFKRSLKLWDRFEIHTTIRGHDERYFFIQQRFQRGGELVATGLVKIRFLRRTGGTVPTQEVLTALGDGHALEEVHELGSAWFELERKHID